MSDDRYACTVADVVKAHLAQTANQRREAKIARLTWLAVGLHDDALVTLAGFAEGLAVDHSRALDGGALAQEQAAREAGAALPPVDPEASPLGRALALVACEVERATLRHGRTFPGGWGPAARPEDREARQRAQDACDAAQGERCASFRDVAEEEVAEVYAEEPGTIGHARELVQVAAVYVRGLLMAMTPEVPS